MTRLITLLVHGAAFSTVLGQGSPSCGVAERYQAVLSPERLDRSLLSDLDKYSPRRTRQPEIEAAECLLRDSVLAWVNWGAERDTVATKDDKDGTSVGRGYSFRHFRQYCGLTNAQGDRLVFINAFCWVGPRDRWRKHWRFVLDGGHCFWQALINLSTGRVEFFDVNDDP